MRLTLEGAVRAADLFRDGISAEMACDDEGFVPLVKAQEVLVHAFETIKLEEDPVGQND